MMDYVNDPRFPKGTLNLSRVHYGLIVLILKINEASNIK
jgi:hypothetical protein